jgi:hypothetical protein
MITNWGYTSDRDKLRNIVKKTINSNNYKTIDVGASVYFWSYPECKYTADQLEVEKEDNIHFKIDFNDKNSYTSLLQYVEQNGMFDYSICSHTLEDIFLPFEVVELIFKISKRGFISMPSKYDEFSYLFDNSYLGNAHHKQIFDVINDKLMLFPKYSFIERNTETQEIQRQNKGAELYLFWDTSFEYSFFGQGTHFYSDKDLINTYFNELKKS